MQQNEQKFDKSKLAMQNDELQQITRQNDKMKTQDEKTMNFAKKHMKQHAMISTQRKM